MYPKAVAVLARWGPVTFLRYELRRVNTFNYFADVAELVDALVLGTSVQKTWGFESLHPHQESEEVIGLERCFKAHYEGHYN